MVKYISAWSDRDFVTFYKKKQIIMRRYCQSYNAPKSFSYRFHYKFNPLLIELQAFFVYKNSNRDCYLLWSPNLNLYYLIHLK